MERIEITRRTALSLLGAVAIPSAATVAVAAAETNQPTPQQRIDAAIDEIEAALAEMYPGWQLQSQDKISRPLLYRPNADWLEGDPYRHTILISAGREEYGPQEVRWFTVDKPEQHLNATREGK